MPIPQLRGRSQFDGQCRLPGEQGCNNVKYFRGSKVGWVGLTPQPKLLANLTVNRAEKIFELSVVTHRFSSCRKSNGRRSRLRFQKYCTQASSEYLGSILPATMFTEAHTAAPTFNDFSELG